MKVLYDRFVDGTPIRLSNKKPENVNRDVSQCGKIVGIEILNAIEQINLKSLFSFEVDEFSFASQGY